ncbi:uncharacterized protein ASCRUDRAFT_77467 [Ascoidea rubescens DSM 1968]|uniref:Uncharacterized protein n=1 Tax=Ascoidea rubescens DSM 1968 TaxID=1344418 RepID=A0A1D2VBY1_9ASCO|nr:hypothetical protein ASCRUDRAFT_77467 [Ascoidea rubescens DSM 1968]ODV59070.1 hypothetical protein ASCRUDRAFT_77467 [Ascoidea rubescens DSM 1968]
MIIFEQNTRYLRQDDIFVSNDSSYKINILENDFSDSVKSLTAKGYCEEFHEKNSIILPALPYISV